MKSFSISEIHNLKSNEEGFTLLELLIVIGIIAVLLAVAVVAINPGQQFAKVNNTRRTHDLQQIISAIQQNMIDNKGPFVCAAGDIPTTPTVMRADDGDPTTLEYDICDCLVPNYLPQIPVDPQYGSWDGDCNNYDTQYSIQKASIIISAPKAQGETISVTLPGEIIVESPPGVPDATLPVVNATSPTLATVNVTTTFSASVSDNVAVTSCNLFVDGVDKGSMTLSTSPCASCSASKDHTFTSTGTFPMYAKCSDAAGNITNGTSVNVNVTAPAVPDFSILANPVTIKAPQTGTSQSATITITSINNFNSAVNLSVTSGLPAGATANFIPNPITPPPNGNATSNFTTVSASNVTAGFYTLTIRGQSEAIAKTTDVTLEVVDLSVSLAANPSSGCTLLNNVDLTATVSGSATGTINYKFDCTNDGTWDLEINNSSVNPYTAVDLCNYSSAGTHTAKVRVQRDVANPAEGTTTITVWVFLTGYPDADSDTYYSTSSEQVCAPTLPLGYSPTQGTDCCDSDTNTHPGQTSWFTSQNNCSSFDYNCDGVQTQRYTILTTCPTGCFGNGRNCVTGWVSPVPSCGTSSAHRVCSLWGGTGCPTGCNTGPSCSWGYYTGFGETCRYPSFFVDIYNITSTQACR